MASTWPCLKDHPDKPIHSWISWRYSSGRVALRCERCSAPHPLGARAYAAEVANGVRKANVEERHATPV